MRRRKVRIKCQYKLNLFIEKISYLLTRTRRNKSKISGIFQNQKRCTLFNRLANEFAFTHLVSPVGSYISELLLRILPLINLVNY